MATSSSTSARADPNTVYDAIVIGTGISGGWAAKELCEQGLKTLVLERGPMVKHIVDYPTATRNGGISNFGAGTHRRKLHASPSKPAPGT